MARGLDRFSPNTVAIALIVLTVALANAIYILGQGSSDPIAWTAAISHSTCGLVCGRPSIDANVGAITQPLGHLAALDVLHGHFPWWNPYEGLGQPLAGEMQSAALFPLAWLLALPAGLLFLHLILEVAAGISTFLLLRRLSIPTAISGFGGVLFALNGTFAWLANSVVNPLAFLPMLLLGVEVIIDRAPEAKTRGWCLVAIALALSLYSGFPEVAYFNALFAAVWAAVRLFSLSAPHRVRALRRLGVGVITGLILSLAILVPFLDFLQASYVGGHTATIDGTWALTFRAIPMLFDPYVYGSLYQNPHLMVTWGELGGYFGAGVVALAITGALGQRLRGLRTALLVWTLFALFGAFNLLGARSLWNILPFVTAASLPRYIMPSCELAVIVLAVLGLADLADNSSRAPRRLFLSTIFMFWVLSLALVLGRSLNQGLVLHGAQRILFSLSAVLPFASLFLVAVVFLWRNSSTRVALVIAVVVAESLGLFFVPTLAAPSHVAVDTSPIQYLQRHQGEDRFVDLSVLYPNWGSQFSLNALNAIDLPFPERFTDLIQRQLFPGLRPQDAFTRDDVTYILKQENELAEHLRSYEDASVKYLLAPRSLVLSSELRSLGVRAVFRDPTATVYQLPFTRPFFSTSSPCHSVSPTVDVVTVSCSTATTLLRTELSLNGWSASVNGHSTAITTVDGVYQEVRVPKGTATVTYSFLPPHEHVALVLSLLAALFLAGSFGSELRMRQRRRGNAMRPVRGRGSGPT
jgi:hypothetical protein